MHRTMDKIANRAQGLSDLQKHWPQPLITGQVPNGVSIIQNISRATFRRSADSNLRIANFNTRERNVISVGSSRIGNNKNARGHQNHCNI